MNLVIVGVNGQLGKEWARFCEKEGIEYNGYDLPELDITDHQAVEQMLIRNSPTALINCAAYTNVDGAESDEKTANVINNTAVSGLAKVCKKQGVKLIHYSTDYVFSGSREDRERNPAGYPEDYPTGPTNVYGVTKLDGELAIMNSECEYLILRISWLCGYFGKNFVKTMLRLGAERDELNVVNDQYGSPTFTKNVVEWTHGLLKENTEGVVHLSSAGITTWYEFACTIFEISGMNVQVNPVDSSEFKTAATRPHFSKMNTSKMSTILGKEPISWQEALQNLLNELSEDANT